MVPVGVLKLLHLFFAFSYVGSLTLTEWNGRAARLGEDWKQRTVLFQIVHLSTRIGGFGSLLLLGVVGNVLAVKLGYSMRSDPWLWTVNGLWLLSVASMALISLPYSAKLVAISSGAVAGGPTDGYASALARWRFGNVVQSILYLALLAFMVFHWHSQP